MAPSDMYQPSGDMSFSSGNRYYVSWRYKIYTTGFIGSSVITLNAITASTLVSVLSLPDIYNKLDQPRTLSSPSMSQRFIKIMKYDFRNRFGFFGLKSMAVFGGMAVIDHYSTNFYHYLKNKYSQK